VNGVVFVVLLVKVDLLGRYGEIERLKMQAFCSLTL
jgi:hypothetical protein